MRKRIAILAAIAAVIATAVVLVVRWAPDLAPPHVAVRDAGGGPALHGKRAPVTWAVGPSVGILGMPGGHSVYTFGLGIRVMGRPTDQR